MPGHPSLANGAIGPVILKMAVVGKFDAMAAVN